MNKKQKRYLKLNLMSLFFAGMSFISITLAWFAYSGLITTSTIIDVKSWLIKFDKNGDEVSNEIVIPLFQIYPGMETTSETINIKNMGDSDADLSYEIVSARVLDKYIESNGEKGYVEDQLSQAYPFHINISLSDTFVNAHDGTGEFVISVSWPLDSGQDDKDNQWGNDSYQYYQNNPDSPAIEVQINLKASQYVGENESADIDYKLGNIILYNPVDNVKCNSLDEENCIQTYVIDKNNIINDTKVTLMPVLTSEFKNVLRSEYETAAEELLTNYPTGKLLDAKHILPIISKDVLNTIIITPNYSNEIVGILDYGERKQASIDRTVSRNGTYRFTTLDYLYFSTSKCIWLNTKYGKDNLFALNKLDNTYSKLYKESNEQKCEIIPIFEVNKGILNEIE